VVLETLSSGISALPFGTFVLLMQPIHLAIGFVEGLATAAVVLFIYRAQPELINADVVPQTGISYKKAVISMIILALFTGGTFSWFASAFPDGLEWSMEKVAGSPELESPEHSIYATMKNLQEKTAFLPDYNFKPSGEVTAAETEETWPAVNAGTSVAGVVGGFITLLAAVIIGLILKKRKVVETA
jgi:cobalt/nickel transport system permease protein